MAFHEVRFPTGISAAANGGPERRTDVVLFASGFEERNARWADSRRSYNAGYGVRGLDDLHQVLAFFEERRGRLHGFRFKDHSDFKSSAPNDPVSALDQVIGTGDGTIDVFQLSKTYGGAHAPYRRLVKKPVAGTVVVAVDGVMQSEGSDFTADHTTGVVSFLAGHIPAPSQIVTAGFEFDVPVRFDTDRLEVNVQSFLHGSIPSIPLVEVRI
ncbi:MAG: DUF2460 domain-containing protein [Hyphomicrobiaceae bacterium]